MTYAEVAFIKAELAFKGLIAGDAETFYKSGTVAAMQIWNIETSTDYFDNEAAKYKNTLEQLPSILADNNLLHVL